MFYEVRVLNSKGKVQKVLSSVQLSHNFWQCFRDDESKMGFRAANNAKLFKQQKMAKS
jgi:hypothetical protein